MQHHIDAEAFGPAGEHMAHAVSTCVHCGFCLAACPTYRELGQEMDSPRGRIVLMKRCSKASCRRRRAAAHRSLPRLPGVRHRLPQRRRLWRSDHAVPRACRDRTQGASLLASDCGGMLLETMPYPERFAWALRLGRLASWTAPLLPAPMRAMLDLVPPSVPPAQPLPALTPARGERRARVALLAGCAQQVLAPDINAATIGVLAQRGVEVVVPPGRAAAARSRCTRAIASGAQACARGQPQAFPTDVDAILTNAAGCGSAMQEYPHLFEGTADDEAAPALAATHASTSACSSSASA